MKLTPSARVRLTRMIESGGRRLLATYPGVTSLPLHQIEDRRTDHFSSSRCSGRTSISQSLLASIPLLEPHIDVLVSPHPPTPSVASQSGQAWLWLVSTGQPSPFPHAIAATAIMALAEGLLGSEMVPLP